MHFLFISDTPWVQCLRKILSGLFAHYGYDAETYVVEEEKDDGNRSDTEAAQQPLSEERDTEETSADVQSESSSDLELDDGMTFTLLLYRTHIPLQLHQDTTHLRQPTYQWKPLQRRLCQQPSPWWSQKALQEIIHSRRLQHPGKTPQDTCTK